MGDSLLDPEEFGDKPNLVLEQVDQAGSRSGLRGLSLDEMTQQRDLVLGGYADRLLGTRVQA